MRDLALLEFRIVIRDVDIEAAAGDETALVERIFLAVSKRDEFVVTLVIRKWKRRDPAHQLDRPVARDFQVFGDADKFGRPRHAIKPARFHIDRMHLAAAEQSQQFVAGALERQTAADDVAMVARHRDRVGIAEKIRRVQHHDVQRVAFDPFARNTSGAAAREAHRRR